MSDTQNIEIDNAVVEAVAAKAAESIQVPSADEIASKLAEKMERTEKKDIHESSEKSEIRTLKKGFDTLPKEVRFAKGVLASIRKDGQLMSEYNAYVNKAWADINKSNYQNVTTTADGGA